MSGVLSIIAGVELVVADAVEIVNMFSPSKWGIFDQSGQPIITGGVLGIAYRESWRVSSYPIEEGAFQNYNKVAEPWEARVQFAVDGSTLLGSFLIGPFGNTASRRQVLRTIKDACASTDLYTVNTPEFIYPSANIVHYDYERRTKGSVSMIVLDVWCEEIRIAPAAAFTNTKAPDGADAQNGGSVQSTTPAAPEPPVPPASGKAPMNGLSPDGTMGGI